MNIIEFLEQNEVEYWTTGKNVSAGYVNIRCLFCGDTSNHLGIRLSDLNCNCWKCGKKSITKIIQTILNCTYKEAKAFARSIDSSPKDEIEEKILRPQKLILPGTDIFPAIHLQYLKERGFNPPKTIIDKYKLKACYRSGKYKYRIVIPIYMNKMLVSFTTRDITDQSVSKYVTCPDSESVIPASQVIFNLDSVDKGANAILVEGPFDVIRLGDGAFCFLGINYTPERIIAISEKRISTLYIMYDTDDAGIRQSKIVSKVLAPFVKNVVVLRLLKTRSRKGYYFSERTEKRNLKIDPAQLSSAQVLMVKKELNVKQ